MDTRAITTARWVRRGNRRKAVLSALHAADVALTATELSARLRVGMKRVSETLRGLAARELVQLLDPDRPFRRRYRITLDGIAALNWIAKRGTCASLGLRNGTPPGPTGRSSGTTHRNRLR